MKTTTVSTRLPPEEVAAVVELAAQAGLDRASMTRALLRRGLKEMRLEMAEQAYAVGTVSLSRAAEMAGMPVWDLLERFAQRNVPISYDVQEFEEDLKHVRPGG